MLLLIFYKNWLTMFLYSFHHSDDQGRFYLIRVTSDKEGWRYFLGSALRCLSVSFWLSFFLSYDRFLRSCPPYCTDTLGTQKKNGGCICPLHMLYLGRYPCPIFSLFLFPPDGLIFLKNYYRWDEIGLCFPFWQEGSKTIEPRLDLKVF